MISLPVENLLPRASGESQSRLANHGPFRWDSPETLCCGLSNCKHVIIVHFDDPCHNMIPSIFNLSYHHFLDHKLPLSLEPCIESLQQLLTHFFIVIVRKMDLL